MLPVADALALPRAPVFTSLVDPARASYNWECAQGFVAVPFPPVHNTKDRVSPHLVWSPGTGGYLPMGHEGGRLSLFPYMGVSKGFQPISLFQGFDRPWKRFFP